jgi:hypothetical protein
MGCRGMGGRGIGSRGMGCRGMGGRGMGGRGMGCRGIGSRGTDYSRTEVRSYKIHGPMPKKESLPIRAMFLLLKSNLAAHRLSLRNRDCREYVLMSLELLANLLLDILLFNLESITTRP